MKTFIKLVLGLIALAVITSLSAIFGIGGFLFGAGLLAVIIFAFSK